MNVEIRVSPRARRARIELPPGRGPLLVVPRGTTREEVEALLEGWRPWLDRQLARRARVPPLELPPLAEEEARIVTLERAARVAHEESPALGVDPRRIRIADQRTRWGSCSAKGTLSFSWRLALAPWEVLDYVVVHELCHLRELNHGARFWALLESVRPRYREPKAWLDRHGHELLAYEASLAMPASGCAGSARAAV
jgi:predicted metal-dependent hydrolase